MIKGNKGSPIQKVPPHVGPKTMDMTQTIAIEPGNRIKLPADWASALGLHGAVTLERTENSIIIRPCRRLTWDEVFATKLPIGQTSPESEDLEIRTDDLFL